MLRKQEKRKDRSKQSKSEGYNDFPKLSSQLLRTLKYASFDEQVSAGISVYTYRLNSLYDPDETGTGSQPYGFDELMAFFNRYRVEMVDVEIEVSNTGTDSAIVAVAPSIIATDPTAAVDIACMPLGQCALVPNIGDNKHTFRLHVNVRDFFGQKENIDQDFTGTAVTNPTRVLYMHVAGAQYSGAAKNLNYIVRINYKTRFLNPKQLTLS